MLAILAVTMFTACSITVVFYLRAAGMIEENYSGILYGWMQQTVKDLDESLKEIYYVDTRAAWDEALRENVRSYISTKNEDNLETVAELLRNHSREYKEFNSLYFVFPGEKMAVTSEEFPVNKQGLAKKDIQKLEEEQADNSFPVVVESLIHEGDSFLSVVQKVEDDNGNVLGYLAADIKERTIYYEYLESVNDEKITTILLVDRNNEIITSGDYSDLGKTFPEITDHDVPDKNGYFEENGVISFFSRGGFSSCGLNLEVPKKEERSGLSEMRLFLIGIFGAFFVMAVLLALWLSRVVCGPLKSMTSTVEKVGEGDLSLSTEVVTSDEIGTLGKEFNHMLDYIEDLIAKVIEEEQQKKVKKAEGASFEERFLVTGLLLSGLNGSFLDYEKLDKETGAVYQELLHLKAFLHDKKDMTALDEFTDVKKKSLAVRLEAELLNLEQQTTEEFVIRTLEEFSLTIRKEHITDTETGFERIRQLFTEMVEKRKDCAKKISRELERAFAFMKACFGDGQETVLFVTGLTRNSHAAAFIREYGCDPYFACSEKLLYRKQEKKLQEECESLLKI